MKKKINLTNLLVDYIVFYFITILYSITIIVTSYHLFKIIIIDQLVLKIQI